MKTEEEYPATESVDVTTYELNEDVLHFGFQVNGRNVSDYTITIEEAKVLKDYLNSLEL